MNTAPGIPLSDANDRAELSILHQRIAQLEQQTAALLAENERLRTAVDRSLAVEEAYRSLVDNSLQGLSIIQDGRNVFVNPTAARITGYSIDELLAMSPAESAAVIHPADRESLLQRGHDRQAGNAASQQYAFRITRKDGEVRWLEAFTVQTQYQGRPAAHMTYVDITERVRMEEELRKLTRAIEQSPVSVVITDANGIIEYVNPYFTYVTGYTLAEAIGQNPRILKSGDTSREQYAEMWQQISSGREWHGEFHNCKKNGDRYWEYAAIAPVYNEVGSITHYVAVKEDITERKQLELQLQEANNRLHEQAIHDPLTGLYNRRYLDETMRRELQRAERHRHTIGVMMLDIDHFKRFNDTYGHAAGDELLRAVGIFLRENIRGEDIACRYGGEEFTLVLPGASLAHTLQRADEICAGLRTLTVEYGGQHLARITVSLGVAAFPDHDDSIDGVIKAADRALYQAKRDGRDRVATLDHQSAARCH